ncbi:hypothetical protein MS2017_0299 [Bathymodiolus thermophilus thioautotrophic gill symbiont]|uniref:Uncharacterized protein n=1 Tax=Bathymodiolus thermophilus thioautotrophic gill symbiont TaxID=2360 RepID=A0A3G3IJZ1_9GAMM|nr:hypothetical protein [Bathymodiolus thermophilus thioautotrophic gill symbiont]AYQ56049.1 hypothetical protein MS2017_0299 [Bathymodiolus thermophilus thioautotrophic gill symbiont]
MKEFMKKTLLAVVLMASLMPVVSNAADADVDVAGISAVYNAETNSIKLIADMEYQLKNPKIEGESGWEYKVHQYSGLMRVHGHYVTVDGQLSHAGKRVTFEYKNLPPTPTVTISWYNLYLTMLEGFRLYDGRTFEIHQDGNSEPQWNNLALPSNPTAEIISAKLHHVGASGMKLQLNFSHELYGDPTLDADAYKYERDAFTFNSNKDFFKATLEDNRKTLWLSHENIPGDATLEMSIPELKKSLKKYYANYDGKIERKTEILLEQMQLPVFDNNTSRMKNITASSEGNLVKIDIEFDRVLNWKNAVSTTIQLDKLFKLNDVYVDATMVMSDLGAGNKHVQITYEGNVERSIMTIDLGSLRSGLTKVFTNFYSHISSHIQSQIDTLDLPKRKPSTIGSIQADIFPSGNRRYGVINMTFDEDLVWQEGYGYDSSCSLDGNACQVVKVNEEYVNVTSSTNQEGDRKKLILTYTIMTADSTVTVNLIDLKAYLSKVLYNFSGDLTDAAKAQFDSLEFPKSFELQMQEKSIKAERDTETHTQTAHTAKETTKSATTVADGFAAKNDAIEAANKAEESANDVSETDTTRKQSANANAQLAKEHAEAAKVAFKELYESKAIQGNWKTPVIKGLGYSTDIYSYEGKTNNKGMYRCQSGEMVTFSLGYIKIAKVTCPPAVTLVSVPE